MEEDKSKELIRPYVFLVNHSGPISFEGISGNGDPIVNAIDPADSIPLSFRADRNRPVILFALAKHYLETTELDDWRASIKKDTTWNFVEYLGLDPTLTISLKKNAKEVNVSLEGGSKKTPIKIREYVGDGRRISDVDAGMTDKREYFHQRRKLTTNPGQPMIDASIFFLIPTSHYENNYDLLIGFDIYTGKFYVQFLSIEKRDNVEYVTPSDRFDLKQVGNK